MRPLELRLRNFRSYFGPDVVFDFRNRRLVGIVGPIGSGKSSILDAVAYALYGKTPTIGRSTKTLIHQRAEAAAVALRFSVNGQVWEVVRSMRQHGASQHALYRLAEDADDADQIEKITLEGDVNARVVDLLGLEFDAFGRSVLLAQGRFADFLRSPPRERDKVLKGVFGHDRIDLMREVAKDQARIAETDAEKVAFQVLQLELKAERLVVARTELVTLEQRAAVLEKAEPEVTKLDETIGGLQSILESTRVRRTALADMVPLLPDAPAVESLLDAATRAEQQRVEAAAAMEARRLELEGVQAALDELEKDGLRDRLEQATSLLAVLEQGRKGLADASKRRDKAVASVTELEARTVELTTSLSAAATAEQVASHSLELAAKAEEAAREALHAAEHEDMASTLQGDLAVGAPCPVCAQLVEDLPQAIDGGAVAAAQTGLASLQQARVETEGRLQAAIRAHQDLAARHGAATDEMKRMVGAVADATVESSDLKAAEQEHETRLGTLLGTAGAPDEVLATQRALLASAVEAVADARKKAESARRIQDEAIEAEQRSRQGLSALSVSIAEIAAKLSIEVEVGEGGIERLRKAASAVAEAWQRQSRETEQSLRAAETSLAEARSARGDVVDELELLTASLAEELGSTRARATERAAEIKRIEAELEAAQRLVADRDHLVARRDVMQRLAGDLTDSKFIRFLLDEERAVLSELGTEHLLRLTSGRYEFDDSGAFNIVDLTAADAVRRPDSLSGGETFLASLALALGLAEMVARTGGRLDAFFLDEGFGSLDPEHLDLAMEGIESLVADDNDRLVVVVSHVPELRHRLEDLIELDRSPTTGDTRVVRA